MAWRVPGDVNASAVTHRMRIGLITPGFSASEADWCIPALLDLVRALAQRHDVRVFALRYPHVRRTYSVYGAIVHALGARQVRGVRRGAMLARALATIVREGRREPFDVLHGLWAHEPGFLAVSASRLLRVPAVVSILGGELASLPEIAYGGRLSRSGWWLTRAALRRARRVTVGSAFLHEQAMELIPGERLTRLPLGVDTTRFQPGAATGRTADEGTPRLLHVASLVPVKDHRTLLQATVRIVSRLPRLRVHLVGEGVLSHDLARFVEELGIGPHVVFHGAIAHDRLPDLYRSADLCVLSSRYESQAMVTLEAAACGRTTVGTAVGLLPELTPSAVTVPVGDAGALADALLDALQDRDRLERRGRAIRDLVVPHFSVEKTTARLLGLYEDLVRAPAAASIG